MYHRSSTAAWSINIFSAACRAKNCRTWPSARWAGRNFTLKIVTHIFRPDRRLHRGASTGSTKHGAIFTPPSARPSAIVSLLVCCLTAAIGHISPSHRFRFDELETPPAVRYYATMPVPARQGTPPSTTPTKFIPPVRHPSSSLVTNPVYGPFDFGASLAQATEILRAQP